MNERKVEVLVVDDEPAIGRLIGECLTGEGYDCRVFSDAQAAMKTLRDASADVVITDVVMPRATGLDVLLCARKHAPDCSVILLTGHSNRQRLTQALALGAYDYLEKPLRIDELLESVSRAADEARAAPRLQLKAAAALELGSSAIQASLETVRALTRAVEAKDPYTRRHSAHVARYAMGIAEELDVPPADREPLRTASLLHDVGKIGVPDHVLTKPGPLTADEFECIRRHPQIGADILANITMFDEEAKVVRSHHERWDGGGYPDGLPGERTPLASRIIGVADAMDAMLMARSYKPPFGVERMMEELRVGEGGQFDPSVARAARRWCEGGPDRLILPEHDVSSLPCEATAAPVR